MLLGPEQRLGFSFIIIFLKGKREREEDRTLGRWDLHGSDLLLDLGRWILDGDRGLDHYLFSFLDEILHFTLSPCLCYSII